MAVKRKKKQKTVYYGKGDGIIPKRKIKCLKCDNLKEIPVFNRICDYCKELNRSIYESEYSLNL